MFPSIQRSSYEEHTTYMILFVTPYTTSAEGLE
jgi:hypothetical protein